MSEDPKPTTNNSMNAVRLPLFLALSLCLGVVIGAKMFNFNPSPDSPHSGSGDLAQTAEKFRQVLYYVDNLYVDSVKTDSLAEAAIVQMLKGLDPHTSYLPAEEVALANSQLEGNFDGIGVEFNIQNDTLKVVTPLAGGPSEAAGILAGDKIVLVDGDTLAGKGVTNQKVFKLLRGPKGTKVKLGIIRRGTPNILFFNITRDKIPTSTVDASYFLEPGTGYIKVTRFGANTYEEFRDALRSLKNRGLERLMLDLRGNPGGYMYHAVRMADELIAGKKLLVYTDGKDNRFDEKEYASHAGMFEEGPVIVLVDEGSASASEIVTGALQDHDRALVVGRRSFGKGLVQKPIPLLDGAEMRLTISRYYTPSGRSIQKPYEIGHSDDYALEIIERYQNGELYHIDSSKIDASRRFKTTKGRTMFGGGGIMPDVFVPRDTSYYTPYLNAIYGKDLLRQFASDYVNSHRDELRSQEVTDYAASFSAEEIEPQFLDYLKAQGLAHNAKEYTASRRFILNELKGHIARLVWYDDGYYRVTNQQDEVIQKALTLFERAAGL